MKKILDENNKPIMSVTNTILKATQIFSKVVIDEIKEVIKEKNIRSVKIILDVTAGECVKYDILTTKNLCDDENGMPFAYTEDENE